MNDSGLEMDHTTNRFRDIFSDGALLKLFPEDRADLFFEALFGDPAEGAYDIRLRYTGCNGVRLEFALHLKRRPDKCLACNLTYGLPQVFTRHPVIDLKGLVRGINSLLNGGMRVSGWELGRTQEISKDLHQIPLFLTLED